MNIKEVGEYQPTQQQPQPQQPSSIDDTHNNQPNLDESDNNTTTTNKTTIPHHLRTQWTPLINNHLNGGNTDQLPTFTDANSINRNDFNWLRKYTPGVWKYELIYKTFFPSQMVNFQKLELLWDVEICHIDDVHLATKAAEQRAIEMRLGMLFPIGGGGK